MVETTVKSSFSIGLKHREWLDNKKSVDPKKYPGDSFYVRHGLDLIMYTDKAVMFEQLMGAMLYFFAGGVVFIFGIIITRMIESIVLPVAVMVLSGGIMVLSYPRFYKVYKIWRKVI